MEFVFLILSMLLSCLMSYGLGRIFYGHRELLTMVKNDSDLIFFQGLMIAVATLTFFIVLCAFNNTFWHLPYLTT